MKTELAFCAFLVLACSAAVVAQPIRDESSTGPGNAVVLIIRHAEDADSGKGLSPLGTTRADGYANYFKNFTIDGKQLKLNYIFATRDSRHSQRPRLTIEPTAEEFGLAIDSRFKNKEFLDLADEIRGLPPGSEILVAWHHGKIPQLLQALGADAKALLPNGKWPDDVFGWVIQLRYARLQAAEFRAIQREAATRILPPYPSGTRYAQAGAGSAIDAAACQQCSHYNGYRVTCFHKR